MATNIVPNSTPMMSTKEIAGLTKKRHGDIIRDIRNILNELGVDDANLRHEEYQVVIDDRGYTAEIFLNKRLSHILVSGYSVLHRAKIVDRWMELESRQAPQTQQLLTTEFEGYSRALERINAHLVSRFNVDEAAVTLCGYSVLDEKFGTRIHDNYRGLLPAPKETLMDPSAIDRALDLPRSGRLSPSNILLMEHGYQVRSEIGWTPTEKAVAGRHYRKAPYNRNGHSGFSLQWSVDLVQSLAESAFLEG